MQRAEVLKIRLQCHPALFDCARNAWMLYLDIAAMMHALLRNRAILRRYFAENAGGGKLHLGCGDNRLPGWLNTDCHPSHPTVFRCDAGKKMPFPSGTFELVFTEHMIEHVPFAVAQRMLLECFRILKPGGRIRIATPDLDKVFALKKPSDDLERAYLADQLAGIPEAIDAQPCFFINRMMRAWGHTFLYDRETLTAALRAAGFGDIRRCPSRHSDDPHFDGLDAHGAAYPAPRFNAVESLVLEATR